MTVFDRISIDFIAEHNIDYRRFHRLAVIRFDDIPFMITQNAGRRGDDHINQQIIDPDRYHAAGIYIATILALSKLKDVPFTVVIDRNLPIQEMTYFYNQDIFNFHVW